MGSNLHFFVFLICIFSCFSAPVPYAESLRRLEELKGKLSELEATLQNFDSELSNGQLVSRGLSPEDQALLDKHKSLQGLIQTELAKGGHTDAEEDAELPDAEEEVEDKKRELELSPEEQALIDKYQSLKDVIAAELAKEGHEDADEDAEIPEQRREINLAAIKEKFKELSPEDQAVLEKFQSKLSEIKAILEKQRPAEEEDEESEEVFDTEDGDEEEDREEVEPEEVQRRGNANVFTYMAQLSESDQALLRRMRSKIPNLQLALDKKNKRRLRGDHDVSNEVEAESASKSAEVQGMFRRGNNNVFTYMNQLSEGDQQLLRKMRSKIPYLQLALDKKNKMESDQTYKKRVQEEEESLVSDGEVDDKLAQFEQTLSPDDLALLKAMKSKLHYLKEALHKEHPAAGEEGGSEAEDVPGADAGPLEDRREAKMDGWNEQPEADTNLGMEESDLQERCPCQKHEGSEKRCACDKQFEERCPKCHEHDIIVKLLAERCPTCHKDRTPDVVVEEVQTRLMNDLEFAKTNGVSVAELLQRIKEKAAEKVAEKVVDEERELEMLANI